MRLFNSSSDLEAGKSRTSINGEILPKQPSKTPTPEVPKPTKVPLQSALEADDRRDTNTSTSERLAILLEKYDPRSQNMPEIFPMPAHRATIRTMYLDTILHCTAKLHRHNWILLSQNELYREMCTPERRDEIQEDLERYTKSIVNYETWLNSMIQKMELDPSALPPSFHDYSKRLAMLECASLQAHPAELPFLQGLREGLAISQAQWSRSNIAYRQLRASSEQKVHHKQALFGRIAMAIFAGATLIVPMIIMVLDPRKSTTLLTTSVFTFAIGLTLAVWMKHAEKKDIIAATAGYAAVLVVFVGAGSTDGMNG